MHKRNNDLKIESGYSDSSYQITIWNIFQLDNCFDKINEIIKFFSQNKEMFFGFYRTDGISLTKNEWVKYGREIPDFFSQTGCYKEIVEQIANRNGKTKTYRGILMVASTIVNEQLYEMSQWIFQYYLESVAFIPKISFSEFEVVFSEHLKTTASDYLKNGYTDMVFNYFDSRHFSIVLNPAKFDVDFVLSTIERIMEAEIQRDSFVQKT